MRPTLRAASLCLLAVALTGCASPPAIASRIDQSLGRAGHYLCARQSDDGAWRSGVYGFFRDGHAVTPHVTWGLCRFPKRNAASQPALEPAGDHLSAFAA